MQSILEKERKIDADLNLLLLTITDLFEKYKMIWEKCGTVQQQKKLVEELLELSLEFTRVHKEVNIEVKRSRISSEMADVLSLLVRYIVLSESTEDVVKELFRKCQRTLDELDISNKELPPLRSNFLKHTITNIQSSPGVEG